MEEDRLIRACLQHVLSVLFYPSIQSITPFRDGIFPVSSDALAGEQTGDVQQNSAARIQSGNRLLIAAYYGVAKGNSL